jgi:hypothetical protein
MSDAATIGTPAATVRATRYVAPLREGGSLPGLVEADDDGLYVLKFRGAGQGPKALVAEVIVGGIARALGLPLPEIVFVELDPALGRAEPDPEIQELIAASGGLNFGIDYLPGSLTFDPAAPPAPDPERAAAIVWLDALTMNVDRTPRNPNLLVWHERLFLIDHGAALYVHHEPGGLAAHAERPFAAIADHVLLPFAGSIETAGERLAPVLDRAAIESIVAAVPDEWLGDGGSPGGGSVAAPRDERTAGAEPDAARDQYVGFLERRLAAPRTWVEKAERARTR